MMATSFMIPLDDKSDDTCVPARCRNKYRGHYCVHRALEPCLGPRLR